ncbi:MAG: SDR family oxidoreductase [Isosphaerales bacterium]
MTTLIIGCGYLGQRAGVLLRRRGERVYGTVRSQGRAAEIAGLGIEPVVADVLEPDSIRGLPAAECILYCVGFDRSAGASMRTVYVDGLRNVLDCLLSGATRFVFASSTGVYGQTGGEWVDEETPPGPRHESGKLCLGAEERVRSWDSERNSGSSAIVLRFAGLYGPGRIVRRAMLERGEPIPGGPDRFLNLIHIDDAARAAVAALATGVAHPIYVIADDRPVTRREYYSRVATLLGAPEPRFALPQPGTLEATRDETNKRIANRRMRAELVLDLVYPDILTGLPAALSSSRHD